MRRLALLLAVLLAGAARVAPAQGVRIEVSVDPFTKDPSVQLRSLFSDARWRGALDDAFRVSMEWKVELWKRRLIDANVDTRTFTVVARREPLLGQYFITIYDAAGTVQNERVFTSRTLFTAALEQPVTLRNIGPRTEGNWYYALEVRISALDDEQFAELERFMGADRRSSPTDVIAGLLLKLVGAPSQKVTATVPVRVP